jgi:NADP-dependent 3-hydroxy acid dehydrogenase YdfG
MNGNASAQGQHEKVCAIVGAGAGNGAAFARRFAKDGYGVALLARDEVRLRALSDTIPSSTAVVCDATRPTAIAEAFGRVAQLGPVHTLIYNAGNFVLGSVDATDPATLEDAFRLNCSGCLAAVQQVLPGMRDRGSGQIIVIGATASLRGAAGALPFATAKAGQRVMAQAMARALGPCGIHVAYVVVDGVIDMPTTRQFFKDKPDAFFMQPDAIADAVAHLVLQERSAWTFELDLRPYAERW